MRNLWTRSIHSRSKVHSFKHSNSHSTAKPVKPPSWFETEKHRIHLQSDLLYLNECYYFSRHDHSFDRADPERRSTDTVDGYIYEEMERLMQTPYASQDEVHMYSLYERKYCLNWWLYDDE